MTVIMYVDGVQVEFLFAVARWGQRNDAFDFAETIGDLVSIRCREMGTAEPYPR